MTEFMDAFIVDPEQKFIDAWKRGEGKPPSGWIPNLISVPLEGDNGEVERHDAYGWTKGPFGMFEYLARTNLAEIQATSLTHIRSGLKIATFLSLDAAAIAAEAIRDVEDWERLDVDNNPAVQSLGRKCFACWDRAGLVITPIKCCDGRHIWAVPERLDQSVH